MTINNWMSLGPFGFDGFGINDHAKDHHPRIATLTDGWKDNPRNVGDLLAAAPELLDALETLLLYDTQGGEPPDPHSYEHEVYELARSAIAKAKGQTKAHKTPAGDITFSVCDIKGDPMEITLTLGEPIEIKEGGDTEEGYHYEYTTYTYIRPGLVLRQWMTTGLDCDGRLDRFGEDEWDGETLNHYGFPEWREIERGQHDYTAEAMGY